MLERSGPLRDLLVLSLEQAVAAPMATCRLADRGARVIKVERPEGDFARFYDRIAAGESAYFTWLNRGKESLVANIKDDQDKALLHRILAKADVFVQNLAPGAASRAGFDSVELRLQHPRLITCDISGYGEEGPYSQLKAYDLLVQAESGLSAITGTPEAPGRVGVSICDIATGMFAQSAILEALLERRQTGVGGSIHVSLFASITDWMAVPLLAYDYKKMEWPRVGLAHPTIAPYGVYPLEDDDSILIGVQNDAEFQRLCQDVLGQPQIALDLRFKSNPERVENRSALDELIRPAFAQQGRQQAARQLETAGIAYGFVNSIADLSNHPQLRRMTVDTPSGPIEMTAPAAQIDGQAVQSGPIPALGEHSQRIREEFS